MARSIRLIYLAVQGRLRVNRNWDAITEKSAVVVTAAEWRYGPDPDLPGSPPGRPHLGPTDVYVTNIGAHDDEGGGMGGVEFYVHAHGEHPIAVVVTITVLDDIEQTTVVNR